MTVAIQVGDILSARVWCTLVDQAAVNTFNYECITLTGGAVTDLDFAHAIDTGFAPFYKGLMPGQAVYDGVQAYFIREGGLRGFASPVAAVTNAGVGTKGTIPVPKTAALIMKYKTNIRGPKGRGRVYLPFCSQDWVQNDGRPSTSCDVYVNSFASSLTSPVVVTSGGSTATMVFCVAHRPKAAVPTSNGQVTTCEAADKFGQMHKRGDYGRPNVSPI